MPSRNVVFLIDEGDKVRVHVDDGVDLEISGINIAPWGTKQAKINKKDWTLEPGDELDEAYIKELDKSVKVERI